MIYRLNSYKFLIVSLIILVIVSWSCNQSEIPVLKTGSIAPMPAEWIDEDTGHRITRLTNIDGDNRSFYFHNNPFIPSPEGDVMIYYHSDSKGEYDRVHKAGKMKQLFALNLNNGKTTQLTHHASPIGGEIVGNKSGDVYYRGGDTIFAVNLYNQVSRVIYTFPDSLIDAGVTSLNADETLLSGVYSVAAKDSILKNNPKKSDFFRLIYEAKLPHHLFTIDINTGVLKVIHSDTAWINHIQFSPTDPKMLMFCHEGPWHKVDRIWNINIDSPKPMLVHKRTMDKEIAGHEFFSVDGKTIWFDLQMPRSEVFYLAGKNLETGVEQRYSLTRNEWSIHYNISPNQTQFAGDGGDSKQVAKAPDGKWIYLFTPNGDSLNSQRLVNMSGHNYDLEPNVHFSPDGKQIIFRANFEGMPQVYAVEIGKL